MNSYFKNLLVYVSVIFCTFLAIPSYSQSGDTLVEQSVDSLDSIIELEIDSVQDSTVLDSILNDTTLSDSTSVGPTDSLLTDTLSVTDSTIISLDSIKPKTNTFRPLKRKSRPRPAFLYPGVSIEQHQIANNMVQSIYSMDWEDAEHEAKRLQKLEKKEHLPPLSYLLLVSMYTVRLQNGEFQDRKTAEALLKETYRIGKKGLEISDPHDIADSLQTTYSLIYTGIKGFVATLKINDTPIQAALDGWQAMKQLEKLVSRDPKMYDAYLGLGIFYCALSKAPTIVKSALSITGKSISLEKGIGYLRLSAYQGQYTSTLAKQYLVQFLSPYMGHLADEKQKIFTDLQKKYPRNPYYLFLELDENLCFHFDKVLDLKTCNRVYKQLSRAKTKNYSTKRYDYLVKSQLITIDPSLGSSTKIDSTFDLREFAFYPVFLKGVKEKLIVLNPNFSESNSDKNKRITHIRAMATQATKILDESSMNASKKNMYLWHIKDGLRVENGKRKRS